MPNHPSRICGQSMTEFIIITPILLLLVLGALQFALIYHAKTTLNYATFEAARAGSLHGARMNFMENALARALAPLYTHAGEVDEVRKAREQVREDIEAGRAEIAIINPDEDAFTKFGIPVPGGVEIPNDNLMYRPATVGASGINIQDANLLKIRVTYCYPLYVPFVNHTIVGLLRDSPTAQEPENLGPPSAGPMKAIQDTCLEADRLPITAQAVIRMQSPPFMPSP